jgi:hypothetical protein
MQFYPYLKYLQPHGARDLHALASHIGYNTVPACFSREETG